MSINQFNIRGLDSEQVKVSRERFGLNSLSYKNENNFLEALLRIVKEPMTILLIVSSTIYFISGETGNAVFMIVAIIFITSISLYQDSRSKNALEKLKILSQPHCKVIRNGKIEEILSEEIVVNDFLLLEEGALIAADGTIVHSNDFSVNESILTGESFPVFKYKEHKNN